MPQSQTLPHPLGAAPPAANVADATPLSLTRGLIKHHASGFSHWSREWHSWHTQSRQAMRRKPARLARQTLPRPCSSCWCCCKTMGHAECCMRPRLLLGCRQSALGGPQPTPPRNTTSHPALPRPFHPSPSTCPYCLWPLITASPLSRARAHRPHPPACTYVCCTYLLADLPYGRLSLLACLPTHLPKHVRQTPRRWLLLLLARVERPGARAAAPRRRRLAWALHAHAEE